MTSFQEPKHEPPPAATGGNDRSMAWERAPDPAQPSTDAPDGEGQARNTSMMQDLKVRIHRQLLDRLNLANLDALDKGRWSVRSARSFTTC